MPLPVVWQVAATGIVETVAVVSWVPDGAAEAETSNSSLARVSAERRHRGANSGLMQKVISHLPDPFFRTGGGSRRAAWRSVSRPMTAAPGPTPKPTDTQPGPGDGIWGEGGGGGVLAVWADLDGRRGLLAAGEVVVVTGGGGGFSVVLRWARRPAEEQGSLPDEPAVAREAQDDGMMERGRAGEGGQRNLAALAAQQQRSFPPGIHGSSSTDSSSSSSTWNTTTTTKTTRMVGPPRQHSGLASDKATFHTQGQGGAGGHAQMQASRGPFCSPRPRPLSRARAPLGWLAGWLAAFSLGRGNPPPPPAVGWLVLTVRRPGPLPLPLPLPLPQTRPRPPRVVPIRLGVGRFGVCPATKRHDAALLACRRPTLVVNVLGGQAGRKLHPPPPPGPPCRVHVAAAAGHGPRPALTRAGLWTKMGAGSVGGAAS